MFYGSLFKVPFFQILKRKLLHLRTNSAIYLLLCKGTSLLQTSAFTFKIIDQIFYSHIQNIKLWFIFEDQMMYYFGNFCANWWIISSFLGFSKSIYSKRKKKPDESLQTLLIDDCKLAIDWKAVNRSMNAMAMMITFL